MVLATGTATTASAATSSVNLTMPTVADGIVIYVSVHGYGPDSGTLNVPAGWTRVDVESIDDTGTLVSHLSVFRRLKQSGDPGSVTFGSTGGFSAITAVAQGYASAIPEIDTSNAVQGAASATHTAAAVNTTVADQEVAAAFGTYYGSSATWSAGAGYTERGDAYVADDSSVMVEDSNGAVAVASYTPTGTGKNTSTGNVIAWVMGPAVTSPNEGAMNSGALHMMGPSYY